MAAGDDNTLRIACRLVCTDQWLVTHVDPSWPILDLKHFLLQKFHRTAQDAVDDDPRAIAVSPRKARRRSLSPIMFAAPLRKPQTDPAPSSESSLSDFSNDPELDDELNITKAFTDAHRYKYNARPSTSSASESVTRLLTDSTHDGHAYVLLTFSTTQILEDRFTLSWYGVHPDELLELHPAAVSFVSLSRCSLDAYIAPYFAARVWALRIVGNKLDSASMLVRNRPREDDGPADIKTPNPRDKNKRKVAVEWKERWAIIHQGMFSLCKERHDTHAAFSAPLSSLLSIRDSAPFNVHLHARRLRKKFPSIRASNVICVKFNTPVSPRHRTFSNESLSVGFERESHGPSSSQSTSSGHSGWWRRSRDVSTALSLTLTSSASVLVGSGSGAGLTDTWFTGRGSKAGLDEVEEPPTEKDKGKGKERDEGEDAVWIILDMLDSSVCSHILRVLHRHAPSDCHSTFLPPRPLSTHTVAPSPIVFSKRSSTPGSLATPTSPTTPGPSSGYSFPPTPSSPTSTMGPPPFYSSMSSTTSFPTIGDSQHSSPTLSIPPTDFHTISQGSSLPYPAWRLGLARAARKAGLGNVGRAMELVMFGDEEEDSLADIEDADEDDDLAIEWARQNSSLEPSPIEPPAKPPMTSLSFSMHLPPCVCAPTPPRHYSDPAVLSSARVEGDESAPEPELVDKQEPEASEVSETAPRQPERSPWQTHPFADLTSLIDTEPEIFPPSDESEAEWDGWVDGVLEHRKQDAIAARARARQAALARSDTLETPSGNPRTPLWRTEWSGESGTPSPAVSASSPDYYHDRDDVDEDEISSAWHWPRGSDTEEGSSVHSSDPQGESLRGPKGGEARSKSGHKTLSSYSSVDSLLRRTMRTNIQSVKNMSLSQARRASMQILFPSPSGTNADVPTSTAAATGGDASDVPAWDAPASNPAQGVLSRPSLGSMRSATSASLGSRSRPLSPLTVMPLESASSITGRAYDAGDGSGVRQGHDFGYEGRGERHADVDDVEETGNEEARAWYDSELGHHPVPLPGMRMVPAGYTTFQHSALYGQGQSGYGGGVGGEERAGHAHAGVAHGQSMQRLPMGMSRMMTTVSSTVSVGPSARRGGAR